MKSSFLAAMIGVAAISSASFDLVLVADNTGSSSGPVMNRIHRYDGDSGTYLGSFNAGITALGSMAADYTNNVVYVAQGNRVQGFNYNTGAQTFLSSTLPVINSIKMHNGLLYGVSSNAIYSVNTVTGATSAVASMVGGGVFRDIAFAPNGSFVGIDTTFGRLLGYSASFSFVNSTSITGVPVASSASLVWDGGTTNGFIAHFPNITTSTIVSFSRFTYSGVFSSQSTGTYISSYATTFGDAATAHDGHWMLARNSLGTPTAYLRNRLDGVVTAFSMPQVTAPGQMAVVLAPEPGTMAALGLGVAALARLRRRRR